MIEYSDYTYKCSSGEGFDSVALAAYGDERYAGEVMNANPALCGVTIFQGGELVRLPLIDLSATDKAAYTEIAPWRR